MKKNNKVFIPALLLILIPVNINAQKTDSVLIQNIQQKNTQKLISTSKKGQGIQYNQTDWEFIKSPRDIATGQTSGKIKSSFVNSNKIIFEDPVEGEKLGEFPSKWDLLKGHIEVAEINGEQVIAFIDGDRASITPLIKEKDDYLPDMFTIEFDHFVKMQDNNNYGYYYMWLSFFNINSPAEPQDIGQMGREAITCGQYAKVGDANGQWPEDNMNYYNKWHHIAISYNKGNIKIYTDQYLLANLPKATGNPHTLSISCIAHPGAREIYIKNVRIATIGEAGNETGNADNNNILIPKKGGLPPEKDTTKTGNPGGGNAPGSGGKISNLLAALVAYYPFTGNMNDETIHKNNGTVFPNSNSTISLTTDRKGKANNAYSFNGYGSIKINNSTDIELANNFTVSFWYYQSGTDVSSTIAASKANMRQGIQLTCLLSKAGGYCGGYSFYNEIILPGKNKSVCQDTVNLIKFYDRSSEPVVWSDCLPINNWYHIVVTKKDRLVNLYVNGMLVASGSTGLVAQVVCTDDLYIGIGLPPGEIISSSRVTQMKPQGFYGKIDDIKIFNRVLTDSEILQLYKE